MQFLREKKFFKKLWFCLIFLHKQTEKLKKVFVFVLKLDRQNKIFLLYSEKYLQYFNIMV